MDTLKSQHHRLSEPLIQLEVLAHPSGNHPTFDERLREAGLYPLRPSRITTLQINVGKLCNQTCGHCHVDAGPDRDEVMSREVMEACLAALRNSDMDSVDITGGAPELNPHFEWLVESASALGKKVMVRSNLTILTTRKHSHLPRFYADHQVTVISSLPCYTAENTDRQRGIGVFEKSIEALQALNRLGYGDATGKLPLFLVYNPLGPSLPPPQHKLEEDYRRVLKEQFGVVFTGLYCITNMPISRFLDSLLVSGKYDAYMEKLVNSFNPQAAAGVMCRNLLSVGWDGKLYDCDFNQMLELGVNSNSPRTIAEFDVDRLTRRQIVTRAHCFGCTAGAGSSCGGEIL